VAAPPPATAIPLSLPPPEPPELESVASVELSAPPTAPASVGRGVGASTGDVVGLGVVGVGVG